VARKGNEDTIDDYLEMFGDTPTLIGYGDKELPKVLDLMEEAMDEGEPISDDTIREKLGLEPLSVDVVI